MAAVLVDRTRPYDQTFALAAGVALPLVFDLGAAPPDFGLSLRNTLLVNAIGTTTIELGMTDEDASYQLQTAAGTAIGSIAASAGVTGIAVYAKTRTTPGRYVRVTMTSASGTSVRVQSGVSPVSAL